MGIADAIIQVYTWSAFLVILIISLDWVVPRVVNRLSDAIDAVDVNGDPMRRVYLMVISAYAVVATWFHTLFIMVLVFIGCNLLSMTSNFAILKFLKVILIYVSNPAYVFAFIHNRHLPYHALVMLCSVTYGFMTSTLYVQDAEMRDPQAVKSKYMRVLMISTVCMIMSYVMYAVWNVINAFNSRASGKS
jgi:hypothetical protein